MGVIGITTMSISRIKNGYLLRVSAIEEPEFFATIEELTAAISGYLRKQESI
jgi:uncharacterized protein YqfB (UPF0267 family)